MGVAVTVGIDALDVEDGPASADAASVMGRAGNGLGAAGERPEDGEEQAQSRIAGNSTTSRRLLAPVNSITSRSMPRPTPPVGGIPASSARM